MEEEFYCVSKDKTVKQCPGDPVSCEYEQCRAHVQRYNECCQLPGAESDNTLGEPKSSDTSGIVPEDLERICGNNF